MNDRSNGKFQWKSLTTIVLRISKAPIALACVVTMISITLHAYPVTQVGNFQFTNVPCTISFPQPFGAAPTVSLSSADVQSNYLSATITNITPQGFTITKMAPADVDPPLALAGPWKVSVNWVATGPSSSTAPPYPTTFAQSGSFQMDASGGFNQTVGFPASINLTAPFGGIPNVITSLSSDEYFPVTWVSSTNVGLQSFSPTCSVFPVGIILGLIPPPSSTMTINWTAVGPVIVPGLANPQYIVLTVIYAPPGTDGGHSTSAVSYQSGSTTGTTTSCSQSFQVATTTALNAKGSFFATGSVDDSFEFSQTSGDSQSLNITKSATATISQNGPAHDGIDHDEDEIWLLLNPTIDLNLSSSSAVWIFDTNAPTTIQYVKVGWLNGDQPMPPGVASALQSAGIQPQEYFAILAADPLANGLSMPPSPRYLPLNISFAYEPPYNQNDPVPTTTYNISENSSATIGTNYEKDYSVSLSLSGGAAFMSFASLTFTDTSKWTWTSKSSASSSSGTSQSASLTVGGPAYGYTGPTVVDVYYDTLYQTFAFVMPPAPELEITTSGTNVILTWPTGFDGFDYGAYILESTSNLASHVWTTNALAPVVVNGSNTVTNPISGTQKFFRLSQ